MIQTQDTRLVSEQRWGVMEAIAVMRQGSSTAALLTTKRLLECVERGGAQGAFQDLAPILLRHTLNVRGCPWRMAFRRRGRHRHVICGQWIKVRTDAAAARLLIDCVLVAEQTLVNGR